MGEDTTTPAADPPKRSETASGGVEHEARSKVAQYTLLTAAGGIIVLALVVLVGSAIVSRDSFPADSKQVFNTLLPMLGTWVGTVLAYYFSKENFKSANESVQNMVQLTVQQKLAKVKVQDKMIPAAKIEKLTMATEEKNVSLTAIRDMVGGKITRVPVLDDKGAVKYIIHQSLIFKFIADRSIELAKQNKVDDITKLSLADLLKDNELKTWTTSLATVSITATLADAKRAMEGKTDCQDVIVTQGGRREEPMLGWLTNVDIGRAAEA